MQALHRSMSKPDDVFLARRFNDFPNAAKARPQDHAVARDKAPRCAAVFRHDGNAAQHAEILPLVINNPPFAGRRFPNAREKTAGRGVDLLGSKARRAGDEAVRRGRAFLSGEAVDRKVERERPLHQRRSFAASEMHDVAHGDDDQDKAAKRKNRKAQRDDPDDDLSEGVRDAKPDIGPSEHDVHRVRSAGEMSVKN